MRVRIAIVVVALASCVAAAVLGPSRAPAQDRPTSDAVDTDAAVGTAVTEIMQKLVAARSGLYPGMRQRDVAKHTKGAATNLGTVWMPLAGSPFAPEGEWHGLVGCFDDEDEPRVDEISVVLLTGDYDIALGRANAIVAGAKLKFALEKDSENPNLVWGEGAGGRTFWIAFGDGVISIDLVKD